ncbi:hypothetical protein CLAIMM_14977 isoform 3 [Cladophialophora immunda]|nr:hypothetical protein CLAIMM_14977 isoform 3 [Cladophialophora immunda]
MSDQDKSALDANKGSVGSQFKPEGSIGQLGEKAGGSLSSEGAVGKNFTPEGSIGGTVQSAAEQMQGDKKPVFDKDGAVGKQFTSEGAIGSVGEVSWIRPVTTTRYIDLQIKDGVRCILYEVALTFYLQQAVGGPFSSKGAIGKQFTEQGAVGGAIQENLGSGKK